MTLRHSGERIETAEERCNMAGGLGSGRRCDTAGTGYRIGEGAKGGKTSSCHSPFGLDAAG